MVTWFGQILQKCENLKVAHGLYTWTFNGRDFPFRNQISLKIKSKD